MVIHHNYIQVLKQQLNCVYLLYNVCYNTYVYNVYYIHIICMYCMYPVMLKIARNIYTLERFLCKWLRQDNTINENILVQKEVALSMMLETLC